MSALIPQSNAFQLFLENPVFLAAICSLFLAQMLKAIIVLTRSHRRSARDIALTLLWKTGGMPSSHSALVTALAVSVAFEEGLGSNLFIVTLGLALIVIRDSVGVRRSSGIQAKSLNVLGKNVGQRLGFEYHAVKEIQGHAPLEVLVGSLLGLFISAAFALL